MSLLCIVVLCPSAWKSLQHLGHCSTSCDPNISFLTFLGHNSCWYHFDEHFDTGYDCFSRWPSWLWSRNLLCFPLVMPVRGLFILPTLVIRMYCYEGNPGKFCVLLELNGHSYLDLVCGFRSIWRVAEYNYYTQLCYMKVLIVSTTLS